MSRLPLDRETSVRRLLAILASLTALTAAPLARADDPGIARSPARPLPRVGMALDAGVPGGAGAVLQLRLLDALRVDAGPMWSGIGFGLKGGVIWAPLRGPLSPTLELEGGWGLRADLSFLARRNGVPTELRPVLANARYLYASALVGVDIGSARGTSFFVRAGLSRLEVRAPGTARTPAAGGTLEIGDSTLRATIPCAKLGVQFWF